MIKIENVNKIYNSNKENSFQALSDISFHIKQGQCVILKGVSGSGKSTLLSLIGSINTPTNGKIEVEGLNIVKLPDHHKSHFRNKNLGFIFQSFNLIDKLTVFENVLAPTIINSKTTSDELVYKALQLANIEYKKDQKVFNLSGGEKQRVAIARAIVNNPKIILADEPTANLDKENSLLFIQTIKKFKQMGKTVIVATHDSLFDDLDFVDNYIHMENGKII